MKDFVEYIAKQLVDQPDSVVIEEESRDDKLILKLKVAQLMLERSSAGKVEQLLHFARSQRRSAKNPAK